MKINIEQNSKKESPNEALIHFIEKSKTLKLINPDKVKNLSIIRAVVFFGSSASGKTFLVNSIRSQKKNLPIQFPRRLITRPIRKNDDLFENINVPKEAMNQLQESQIVDIENSPARAIHHAEPIVAWKRNMENQRTEQYGFEKTPIMIDNQLKIFSGNNDLARNKNTLPYIDDSVLWIGVYAPDDLRAKRIKKRSPDLSVEEVAYRLGDKSENIMPLADIIINNYGHFEGLVTKELNQLISELIAIKRKNLNK